MFKEKVSIIIPVFNQSIDLLEKCITSIVKQTYTNLEILVIDDGSNSEYSNLYKNICESDKRIIYHYKKNSGVSSTRNYGISKSTGEYVCFIDSDDWIELNTIELMVSEIQKKSVDIVRTTYYINDKDIETIRKYRIRTGVYSENQIRNELIPAFIRGDENSYICLLLIKQEYLKNIQFDKNIGMLEDKCFFISLLLSIKSIALVDYATYHYYQNDSSKTKSVVYYEKNIFDLINAHDKIKSLLIDNNLLNDNIYNEMITTHLLLVLKYLNLCFDYDISKYNDVLNKFYANKSVKNIIGEKKVFKTNMLSKLQLVFLDNKNKFLLKLVFYIKKVRKKVKQCVQGIQ